MDERAQGSSEYLILIGGAVLVSVVIITLVLTLTGSSKAANIQSVARYRNVFDRFALD